MDDKNQKKPKIVRKKGFGGWKKREKALSDISVEKKDPDEQRPGLFVFTLIVLYKNLYILGIDLTRKKRRFTRRVRRVFVRLAKALHSLLQRVGRGVGMLWDRLVKRIKAPFLRIDTTYRELKPAIQRKKEQGIFPKDEYLDILDVVGRLIWKIFVVIFSYAAPIIAAWFLVMTIRTHSNPTLGLAVQYLRDPDDPNSKETIGYVENEAEYDKAAAAVRSRVIEGYETSLDVFVPYFELVVMQPRQKYSDTGKLADAIIRISSDEVQEAFGLYVDDEFYGAVTDKDPILAEMEAILQQHATGVQGERVEFVKSIKLDKGLYPLNSMVGEEDLIEVIHSDETVDEVYIVQEGDSPMLIADKTGVPYSVLIEYNPELEDGPVRVGQEVYTAVARPFLSVKNIYTVVYNEEFDHPVREEESDKYAIGYSEVLSEGVNGLQEVTAEISEVNGVETERTVKDTRVVREAEEEIVLVGTNDPTNIPSGYGGTSGVDYNTNMTPRGSTAGFGWPTAGGRVTVSLGGYPGHTGVDIPRPAGTPVYASQGGVVVKALYTGTGYGNYVVVDHGNGYETLYAHNTSLYVSVGERVSQGQVIAAVGRTGNATGNHVHFEVRENGQIRNPINYIGTSG